MASSVHIYGRALYPRECDSSRVRRGRNRLYSNDNLADLLIRLEVAICLHDLIQWKCLGDGRLEVAMRQALQNQVPATRKSVRLAPNRGCDPAAYGQSLQRRRPMWIRGRLTAQPAVDDDDALLRGRLGENVDVRASHRIECNTRALPPVMCRTSFTKSDFSVAITCFAPSLRSAAVLAPERVTATGTAPAQLASWIAAKPTLLEAARIRTVSPTVACAAS